MTLYGTTPPTRTMLEAMEDLATRMATCQAAYDTYADGCNRRSTREALYEVQRNLDATGRWLKGDNDQPVALFRQYQDQEWRDAYRIHYASDSLVGALHHILGAEYYAGTRSLEEIDPIDPWRYEDGRTRAEEERLRLAEGITFRFPQSVLS
jgi:hypothetical protein